MVETNDFKKGMKILVDGQPFNIVEFEHVKPGKGNQFTRVRLKNLLTGQIVDRTFKSGEKFPLADVVQKEMSFLYKDDSQYYFMDKETFDQVSLDEEKVGSNKFYLTENLEVYVLFFNGIAVSVEVPKAVHLKVVHTEPGFKGDTVTGATKPATLETGLIVKVPLHINIGDILRIDTQTGEYVGRVND